MNIVEAVQKGMSGKYIFHDPSFSEPIKYRAITRYEHEMAKIDAMKGCSLITMQYLADQASLVSKPMEELDEDGILEYRKYVFDMIVNIVYHGTKDFQGEEYTIETIKSSFMDVLELSKAILECSVRPKEEVIELVSNNEGKNLLAIHYQLNVPLVNEAWKLTPLQCDFLVNGKLKEREGKQQAPKGTITQDDLDKDPEKFKEYLKSLFNV